MCIIKSHWYVSLKLNLLPLLVQCWNNCSMGWILKASCRLHVNNMYVCLKLNLQPLPLQCWNNCSMGLIHKASCLLHVNYWISLICLIKVKSPTLTSTMLKQMQHRLDAAFSDMKMHIWENDSNFWKCNYNSGGLITNLCKWRVSEK